MKHRIPLAAFLSLLFFSLPTEAQVPKIRWGRALKTKPYLGRLFRVTVIKESGKNEVDLPYDIPGFANLKKITMQPYMRFKENELQMLNDCRFIYDGNVTKKLLAKAASPAKRQGNIFFVKQSRHDEKTLRGNMNCKSSVEKGTYVIRTDGKIVRFYHATDGYFTAKLVNTKKKKKTKRKKIDIAALCRTFTKKNQKCHKEVFTHCRIAGEETMMKKIALVPESFQGMMAKNVPDKINKQCRGLESQLISKNALATCISHWKKITPDDHKEMVRVQGCFSKPNCKAYAECTLVHY